MALETNDPNKQKVYAGLIISAMLTARIKKALAVHMSTIAAGQIRKELGRNGYGDRAVALRDSDLRVALKTEADKVGQSIQETFNTKLALALARLPDGLQAHDYRLQMDEQFSAADRWNKKVLGPWVSKYARGQAINHFYDKNGIDTTWVIDPQTTAGLDDVCDEAVAAGEVTSDERDQYGDGFFHRGCPHLWVPATVDASTLPSQQDLWFG